jgi:hypothetical protein
MMELGYRFSFDAAHKFSHYSAGQSCSYSG